MTVADQVCPHCGKPSLPAVYLIVDPSAFCMCERFGERVESDTSPVVTVSAEGNSEHWPETS